MKTVNKPINPHRHRSCPDPQAITHGGAYHLMMHKLKYVFLVLLLTFSAELCAGVSNQLYEEKEVSCKLKVFHDAVPGENGVLVIKLFDAQRHDCDISREKAVKALDMALINFKNRNDLAEISSVFLGRLISYKWLSDNLLRMSKDNAAWNVRNGRPVKGTKNNYVNSLLHSSDILQPFYLILSKNNYKVSGISCEKILVNKEKLPFDGMCWITLQ